MLFAVSQYCDMLRWASRIFEMKGGGKMDIAMPSPPGRGRPRGAALDERSLEQVLALLGSRGYAGLTLDELAVRSGVAKTTILRRWPSKAAVAAAGVERLALQSVDVPDFGTLRADLLALLQGAAETFVRGPGQFVPRLLREAGHHP